MRPPGSVPLHRVILRALVRVLVVFAPSACGLPPCDCIFQGLSVSSMAVPFGQVTIGTSRAVVIQLMNTERDAVTIKSIALAAATSDLVLSDVLAFDCQNNPRPPESAMTLAVGACVTFSVRYSPLAAVELNDEIIILSNALHTSSITIPVSGSGAAVDIRACFLAGTGSGASVVTGTCAPATVPPAILDFGTAPVASATSLGLRVFNDGMKALEITGEQIEDPNVDFALIGAPRSTIIAPASSIDLIVQFIPQTAAIASGNLLIQSTDPAYPTLTVPLTGTGRPPSVCLSPSPTLEFWSVTGGPSQQRSLTLTNCERGDNTITALQLLNTGTQGPFTTTTVGPGALPALPLAFPAGASVTIDFTYAPVVVTLAGSRDFASFHITTALQDEIVQLFGEGSAP